jgi:hypothetical protein
MVVNMRKLSIGILIIIVFISSCIAGFYTLKHYYKVSSTNKITNLNDKSNIDSNNVKIPVSAAVSTTDDVLISEKTKIVKRYNYNMGIPTTKEVIENAGPDVLGMNRQAADNYFNKQQFYISDFSSKNVTVFKDINSWPPNYYVVKAENGVVNIYKTDGTGKLQFLKKAQYDIGGLPATDLDELEKGKAFPNLEDINNMFDELNS